MRLIADAHAHELGEKIRAHLPHDGAREADHDEAEQVLQGAGEQVEDRHQRAEIEHPSEIHPSRARLDGADGGAG